jgi:hypothetical protein
MNWAMPAAPLGTDGSGIETAFLPDHTGEKLDRERVLRRCVLECPTNVVRCRLMRRSNLFDLSRRCGTRLCVGVPITQSEGANEQRSGQSGHAYATLEVKFCADDFPMRKVFHQVCKVHNP